MKNAEDHSSGAAKVTGNFRNKRGTASMNLSRYDLRVLVPLLVLLGSAASSFAGDAEPPRHPFLADSGYAMLHANAANTDSSYVNGPIDETRRLREDEIVWKPLGPGDGWEFLYSGPYPDGRRVIWAGGSNAVFKLDADTLRITSTHVLKPGRYYAQEQVAAFMDEMNERKRLAESSDEHIEPMARRFASVMVPVIRGTGAFYRMVSNDNEHYQMTNDVRAGTSVLEVYGDATDGDPDSDIELRRWWEIPQSDERFSAGVALNMTYDGWVIIATADGWVYAVSRDLGEYHRVSVRGSEHKDAESWMAGFIRNGIAIDDDGGIYVLTQNRMHRVQWTGKKLSTDPADGAWAVAYPSGLRGSGTTPTLMGWGANNDKLVLIADGVEDTSFRVYWRGEIPDDWKGIPGEDRQLAGIAPVTYGEDNARSHPVPLEASISAYGYGFFTYNDYPLNSPPKLGEPDANIFANVLLNGMDKYALKGGVKYVWNPEQRVLELAWTTSEPLGPAICSPTNNGLLFCMARHGGEWALQALDWDSGESVFHYLLGDDMRFNPGAAVVRFAPNGQIDCPCGVGWGMLRLSPKPQ